ncbi:MAG: hypothetical protein L3J05_02620 [Robiginitomaculum sp.]|nr:hypothetical protein [Robiginitomaculum sp.]
MIYIIIILALSIAVAIPVVAVIFIPWVISWRLLLFLVVSLLSYDELTYIQHWEDPNNLDLQIKFYYFTFIAIFLILYQINFRKIKWGYFPSPTLKLIDNMMAAYFGLTLSFFILRFFSYYFAQHDDGFLIHSFIGMGSCIAALILFSFIFLKKHTVFLLPNIALISTFLFVSLASFAGMYYPEIVLADAKDKAQESAYCIDLDRRKRAVLSKEDLTLFTMDKRGSDRHAALLVEKDGELIPYHWSYWQQRFLKGLNNWGNHNRPAIACKPRLNFADNLPLRTNEKPYSVEIYFKNNFLTIPGTFTPLFSVNYISISAITPDFRPVQRKKFKLYPSVEIRSNSFIISSAKNYMHGREDEFVGTWEDFQKRDARKKYLKFSIQNDENEIITFIRCRSKKDRTLGCYHRFYQNERMYSFIYDMDNLPQSQEKQVNHLER